MSSMVYLRPHFKPISSQTSQIEGATRNTPKIDFWWPGMCNFGIMFEYLFGYMLGDVWAGWRSWKHEYLIVPSDDLLVFLITVTFWGGAHFGPGLDQILDPFWHHHGLPFWFYFGFIPLLSYSLKFWSHFFAYQNVPQIVPQNNPKSFQKCIHK